MIRLDRFADTPSLRIAAAVAALALVVDLGLLAHALRTPAEERVVPLRLAAAPPIVPRAVTAKGLIQSAARRAPFDPIGAPPQLASAEVVPQATLPAAQPRLVGTVAGGAESFVVVAMPEGTIKVVHVGERAGDLKLRSVSAGGAVFDDIHGERVTLRSPTPGVEPLP
jgi:hypothetical protein